MAPLTISLDNFNKEFVIKGIKELNKGGHNYPSVKIPSSMINKGIKELNKAPKGTINKGGHNYPLVKIPSHLYTHPNAPHYHNDVLPHFRLIGSNPKTYSPEKIVSIPENK